MSELKPCPFCGGKARISADPEATRDSQGRLWAFTVVCDSCCASSGLTFKTEEAIEAWNRRAENEELRFTRQFIHEQGLEFALASAWKGRAEDGK